MPGCGVRLTIARGTGPVSVNETHDPNRRDFLYVATGTAAVIGAGAVVWPFIDQMRPDASTLALSTIEVDVSAIEPGMSVTAKWRGRPVFIRNRTAEEIEAATGVELDELKDPVARNANISSDAPATDLDRSAGEGKENWIVMVGVCTHLGCVPLGQAGDFGGWFCPCHGSHYDTAGRIRKGPAPENLAVPIFEFVSDTTIRIG
ncbi:ubiquinol-cytochrome c reductase iron-sulfur subunit [Nitratireductor sp. CAU 1489]|uniref:Ubiquinol-cytochrome c reductase iron-sulfur subunit n=1 Tax=Nitratireductor arenosus TaxID=2682096 RepID=A0A844QNH9_9HYPH|nr:ubiquinol-cytochrome c reductase iron-sulfur subunit [Nitratireductor arenosus]